MHGSIGLDGYAADLNDRLDFISGDWAPNPLPDEINGVAQPAFPDDPKTMFADGNDLPRTVQGQTKPRFLSSECVALLTALDRRRDDVFDHALTVFPLHSKLARIHAVICEHIPKLL